MIHKVMRRLLTAIVASAIILAARPPASSYTLQYRDNSGIVARRWLTSPILISFSTSLSTPPSNIKAGSDVIGATRRALRHWAEAADIQFMELTSSAQTMSPQNVGDGINLISVSADNAAVFGASESPGRTRVFYDAGGAIVEADIALNPNELFSSDSTPGTYDLESTLTHETGHLIGLDHSAVIGATMQPRQPKNGLYNLPALTQRTLSEDDYAGARSLYGPRKGIGSISGKLMTNAAGRAETIFGGHVFAEDIATGKVVAGSITLANGDYHLDGLPAGEYRLIGQSLNGPVTAADIAPAGGSYFDLTETTPSFRSFVGVGPNLSQLIKVSANWAIDLNFFAFSIPPPSLKPEVIGMNDELSTAALPLQPGKTFTIYIGGFGVDQVPVEGISLSSPFMSVNAATVRPEEFATPFPVISFDVKIARNVPPGDYSIRLRSSTGELAYLAGAVTIERESNSK